MGKQKSQLSVTIIGAGIGGLTLALQLHAHGYHDVNVFESTRQLKPLGVGINLQPSAVLIYRNLGLLPDIKNIAIYIRELNFYNEYGNKILSEPRGLAAGYNVPQASISRGDLQILLLRKVKERLGEDSVHQGHVFEGFDQDSETVTARFLVRTPQNEGTIQKTVTTALLVAADGINSTARQEQYPDEGSPKFSGRMLWRGCCEGEPFLTGASMIMAGHARQFFVAYPIANHPTKQGRQSINWVCCLRVRSEDDTDTLPPGKTSWTQQADKNQFLHHFESWKVPGTSIQSIVEGTDTVYEYPMCDRDPIPRWSFGRFTMLGDAAHPMYPIGGNGATQAVLDSVSLVEHLEAERDVSAALQAYESERIPVTSKIVLANRGTGNNEYVMELIHKRAPNGFRDISDVVSKEELEAVGQNYKTMTGADKAKVNAMATRTEELPKRYSA